MYFAVIFNFLLFTALKALNDLHLKVELRSAIDKFGWQKIYINELSTVIPVILEGQHVIIEESAQPNLHLRKIATLVLPILQQIRPTVKCCQALVLVPSRELAQKVSLKLQIAIMYTVSSS